MCKLLFCLTLCVFVGQVEAKIVANQLKCEQDGTSLTVYLAYDDTMLGKRPTILQVHEWWGA